MSTFSPGAAIYTEPFTQVPLLEPYDALYNLALAMSKALGRTVLKVLGKIMIIFLTAKMK